MKLISWNVNGLRACIQKGFLEVFQAMNADFFCLQETKLQEGQLTLSLPGYHQYWCHAEKKGYSGTAIFTKHKPLSVSYGIGVEELDNEGRVITLEYPEFYLVNCYTPNAQRGLARLDHRMKWDEAYRAYIAGLDAQKPTILCGDLNVAHQEIDLKNPASNRGSAGFSDEERESFTKTLSLGFTDTFRYLNPDVTGAYSWWSYMYHARENNAGWRIDYFLVSDRIRQKIYNTPIYSDILGSDHCPVGLELDIPCNGSVWMDEVPGKPEVILPEKKGAKKAVTVLLALFAILTITGLGGFAVKLFSPSETAYVSFHPYDRQLLLMETSFHGLQYIRGQFLDNKTSWNLYSMVSSIAPPKPMDIPNFWLRLDLTEDALNAYNEEWTLTVSTDRPLTIGTKTSLEDTCDLVLLSYYEGDDPTAIRGWFLYGRLPGDTKLYFNLNTGSSRIRFTYEAKPSITSPSTADAQKLTTETLVERIVSNTYIQQELTFSSGTNYSDTLYENLKSNNGDLIELEKRKDAVTCLLPWLQDGSQKQKLVAHILLSQEVFEDLFSATQENAYFRLTELLFTLTAEEAEQLPTIELVNHILEQKYLKMDLSHQTYFSNQSIADLYPVLRVLENRDDAISVLMDGEFLDHNDYGTIYTLLELYRSKMTIVEEVRFITKEFRNCPILDGSPFITPMLSKPAEECTTEELIRGYLLDSGLGKLFLLARSSEVRHRLYAHYERNHPDMTVLCQRDDIADTLFAMVEKERELSIEFESLKSMMWLSFVQSRMTTEQEELFLSKYSQPNIFFGYSSFNPGS